MELHQASCGEHLEPCPVPIGTAVPLTSHRVMRDKIYISHCAFALIDEPPHPSAPEMVEGQRLSTATLSKPKKQANTKFIIII